MSGDKKIEKSERIAPDRMSDSSTELPEEDMSEDGIPCESIPSVSCARDAVSVIKGTHPPLASVQGVYYPPTSCYDYYYPGYNGFALSNNKGYFNSGSYTGIQPNNASLLYYLPDYCPYTPGFVGIGGKQAYASSKCIQQPCSYQSEAFPFYTYGSTFAGNPADARFSSLRSVVGPSGSGKSNGLNIAKTNNNLSTKASALPFNPIIPQPTSHFSRSIYQNLPLNKLGSCFQSSGLRNPCVFTQYSPAVNYHLNDRVWNNTYRYKSRESFGRSEKAGTELTRGPRSEYRNNSEVELLEFTNERDEHNLQKFQTEYDSAKFYVIKSYSEDDIHKCIKYDVWSSTTNGNKRLDAAFREADTKTCETGIKCPVFLFFSVNGSGQFVGIAEMIGPVDFSENMDFWQLDKWNGFFPVKWHIIKDVPNTLLRHITLENNESRPVTYSRDTQEIGFEKGLDMLRIFKNHSGKTSVLDDFSFYENREKALKARRNKDRQPSQTNASRNGDCQKHLKDGEQKIGEESA